MLFETKYLHSIMITYGFLWFFHNTLLVSYEHPPPPCDPMWGSHAFRTVPYSKICRKCLVLCFIKFSIVGILKKKVSNLNFRWVNNFPGTDSSKNHFPCKNHQIELWIMAWRKRGHSLTLPCHGELVIQENSSGKGLIPNYFSIQIAYKVLIS